MKLKYYFFLSFLISISLLSCSKKLNQEKVSTDDGILEFIILQINDVYEIGALSGGKIGGMARVATLRKELLMENTNTLTILSGDFLNPSLIGTLKHEGERIRGRQMVEVMNHVGVDLVCFGNHEFDLNEEDLQKRINESTFDWVSTNYQEICGDKNYPFYKEVGGDKMFFPRTRSYKMKDKDGTEINTGFFSATLPTVCNYTYYEDYTEKAIEAVENLRQSNDVILGITHLFYDQDSSLATELQGVPIFFGGHDHDHILKKVSNTIIAKADANAKSAYIHRITHNKKTRKTAIQSELKFLNEKVIPDPSTTSLVKKWQDILNTNIKSVISNPNKVIYQTMKPLDGRESSIRNMQTNLGEIMTDAMLWTTEGKAEAAILNSGSVRIDDQIEGDITAVDIFRALPYGGKIIIAKMKGSLLKGVLDYGRKSKGEGAYLQLSNIVKKENKWMIGNKYIDDNVYYNIAMNDYLILGIDIPFLDENNTGLKGIQTPVKEDVLMNDIRAGIVAFLKSGE